MKFVPKDFDFLTGHQDDKTSEDDIVMVDRPTLVCRIANARLEQMLAESSIAKLEKENAALRSLFREARDIIDKPRTVDMIESILKRIDAVLGEKQ